MSYLKLVKAILVLMVPWIARIFGLVFIIFTSFFALDVFGEQAGFWKTLLAFFLQLIPTLLLILALVLSWKRPWIGTLIFILAGAGSITWKGFESPVICYSLFLIGFFFLLNWVFSKAIKHAQDTYQVFL